MKLPAWLVSFVVLVGSAAYAQDDAFVRQRDAEAANNESTGFSVSFADDRRTFHVGETITLRFTFHRYDVSPFNYDHCQGLGLADAVLDHSDGAVDPQADLWNNGVVRLYCGTLSGVVGGLVRADGTMVPSPPVVFAVYLNQAVRFDRPGKYRFYVRSRHRIFERQNVGYGHALVSNVLELEIVDRDALWEPRTLQDAVQILDSSADSAERNQAARVVSNLGSADAIHEMADRFDRLPPSARVYGDADPYFLRGLFGARERGLVVAQMEHQLDRVDRRISPYFVSQLAVLDLTRRLDVRPIAASAYVSCLRSYGKRRYTALKAAGRLHSELERTFADAAEFNSRLDLYGLVQAYPDFPEDVESAFGALSPAQQRTLLAANRNWVVLHDSAFIPMLRRLAGGTSRGGPQDIALRLLYDLAPDEGRRVALRELGDASSSMGIVGLDMLPDAELPQFDDTLVRSLEVASTVEQYGQAIERIARFGSARIFRRVRRRYERFGAARGCDLAPAALSYFFRVAPKYARAELGKVMEEVSQGATCERGVLPPIAARRMLPAIEDAAIGVLHRSVGWVTADAAAMLQRYGTAQAEAALWRAFERWHGRWKGQAARLERDHLNPEGMPWDELIEHDLSRALKEGTGWIMNQSSMARLTALCLTRGCRESVDQALQSQTNNPVIMIHAPALPRAEPAFGVIHATYGFLSSRAALHRWLLLQPAGITLTWLEYGWLEPDDPWLPGEAESYFEEARAFAESHGVKLLRRR